MFLIQNHDKIIKQMEGKMILKYIVTNNNFRSINQILKQELKIDNKTLTSQNQNPLKYNIKQE